MIVHIFKMVWNRKGANALIGLEILIAFLVLFGVCAVAVYHFDHYRRPLGFDVENVWKIDLTFGEEDIPALADVREELDRMLSELRSFDQIEAAAGLSFSPYSGRGWRWRIDDERGKVFVWMLNATDEADRVLGVELLRGRWFESADDADPARTLVINEEMARSLFPGEDPLGKTLVDSVDDEEVVFRVVGLVRDFRYRGELAEPVPFAFVRPQNESNVFDFLQTLMVRVRPGVPAAFEEAILERLQSLEPEWSFKITPLAAAREEYLRRRLAPLLVAGLVAGFLMIMVALGLVGVLWQSVTQRIRELGLRRAKGATAARIRRQVLGELLILTALALAVGVLVVVQLPITGWFPAASAGVYLAAVLLAAALMGGITLLAGLYPSYLATRVEPAEALHYE